MIAKCSKPFFTSVVFFRLLELGCAFGLFVAFVYLVFSYQFDLIVKIAVPLVAVFFGFSSLLFNRARAYTKGRSRVRTLYAAERALQATLFALIGLLVGGAMYGLFFWFGFSNDSVESGKGGYLLVFILPNALIQVGFVCFLVSLRIAGKDYLKFISSKDFIIRINSGL